MFKRGFLIACLGFATVMLFQNCGGGGTSVRHIITSSPELAKLSPENCSLANLHCSKRQYAPGLESAQYQVRECFALRDQEICLPLPLFAYDSSASSTETSERIEYSCWLGPVEQSAAFALRSSLAQAATAALAICETEVNP